MWTLRAAATLGALCVAGCSVFTSLDGYSDRYGVSDAGGGDGPAATSDADAGTWCESHRGSALFCEDFDTPSACSDAGLCRFPERMESGGRLSINSDRAASPPAALLAVADPSAVFSQVEASWISASVLSVVTLRFDVRVEATSPPPRSVQFAKLVFRASGGSTEVGLGFYDRANGGVITQYTAHTGSFQEAPTALPFRGGDWMHVAFTVRPSASGSATFDLDVDGVRVADAIALADAVPPGTVDALLGIAFAQAGHSGWSVRVDNVIIEGS